MSEKEKKVFDQEISKDELESVSGGFWQSMDIDCHIQNTGFPNCRATVEEGSWCETNDACYELEVNYFPLHECDKAWR